MGEGESGGAVPGDSEPTSPSLLQPTVPHSPYPGTQAHLMYGPQSLGKDRGWEEGWGFSHPAALLVAPPCSNPLCRCRVDAHPHTRLRGYLDWLCLQPGPVPPGWPGLCCASLAPPAAAGLCTFFWLLHLLLVSGTWGGRPCHRSPEGSKRQAISQSWAHTPPHRVSQSQKATPNRWRHGTHAKTKAVGGRLGPGYPVLWLPPVLQAACSAPTT